ncbi:MAG: hypothetical protein P4L51_28480 [Puia sp.]|nr:hypothetical protein [Puia sp.]
MVYSWKIKGGIILLGTLLPLFVVYWLYATTYQPNKEDNGFSRRFAPIRVVPKDTLRANKAFAQLCGVTDNRIYLQYLNNPTKLLETDWEFSRKWSHSFALPLEDKILKAVEYQVDSPYVNIFAGNGPDIFQGNLNSPTLTGRYHYPGMPYAHSYARGNNHFILYAFYGEKNKIGEEIINWDPIQNRETGNTKTINDVFDGGVSSDGVMNYDSTTGSTVYIPFYKNGITVIDSAMNYEKRIKTIDTVSYAKTSGGEYKENGETRFTNNTPQFNVNWIAETDQGRVYINCLLRADNEPRADFKDYSDMDVYDIKTSAYLHSFKIPRLDGDKFYSFKIHKDRLIALYPDGVVTYLIKKHP